MTKHNTPCHDNPDMWFRGMPANTSRETKERVLADIKDAIRICESCPLQAPCASLGMEEENLEHGIWGGLLAAERLLEAGITDPALDDYNRKRDTQEIRSAFALLYAVKPWLKVA